MASPEDQGTMVPGSQVGNSTRRATLRGTNSSRTARDTAALRICRRICTLRTDWPDRSLSFRNV